MQVSQSAKLFQERAGLVPTRRAPVRRDSLDLNAVHGYPLAPPLPDPAKVPDPGADQGAAEIWPPGATI